jgi:multidrug efflux system membrane fusion protein
VSVKSSFSVFSKAPAGVLCAVPAALSLLLLAACSGQKRPMFAMGPVAVRAVSATSADVPLEISAIGNVEATSSVDIKSRVAGQIVKVNFQEGQDVHAGDVMFELDQEPFLQAIHEAEANLSRDTALAAQSRANALKDQAQMKSTQAQADRAIQLQNEGINSKEQTETLVATADALKATLEADKAAVTSADASIRADRAKLEDAKIQLSYTVIKAPISGRSGAIQVKAGNLVKENDTTLVTILQTQPIYVTFSIPEQQLPEVRKYNAQHPLTVDVLLGGANAEHGKLNFVDNTVDMATGTIKLKAVYDNPRRQLWPGQFVDVRAQLVTEPGRVVVPTQTVQTGPEGRYVWVMGADDTVTMRPVKVLRAWGEKLVIDSGLTPGERVISEGQMRLAPGSKVKLLKPKDAAEAKAFTSNSAGS